MSKPNWLCRVCGGDSYTGPFLMGFFECDKCSAVFRDPAKWSKPEECEHEWFTYPGGAMCVKCHQYYLKPPS